MDSIKSLSKQYFNQTPQKLKLIDAYLVYLMLTGVIQFVYCVAASSFPFNSFISGFASNVGQFVLTASLRMQVNPENKSSFKEVSPERAFGDYVFASLILHTFVVNYIG